MLQSLLELVVCKRRRSTFPASEELFQIKRHKPALIIPLTPLNRSDLPSFRGKISVLPELSEIKDPETLYRRLISIEDEDNSESLKAKIRRLSEVVKLAEENLRKFRRDKETETGNEDYVAIEDSEFQVPAYVLSNDEEMEVERLWDESDGSGVVRMYENIPLSVKDLKTLRGSCWLNDEVVNSYGCLLSQLDDSILIHNSFFLTLLSQRTSSGAINLPKIDRIHKRKNVTSIFTKSKILIPVNINNAHWVCYCIDNQQHTITYYDSFPHSQFNPLLSEYLEEELKRAPIPGVEAYTEEVAKCPQQQNGVDCGAFMLMNMRNCVGKGVEVTQDVMQQVRRMIAWELILGRLRD